MTAKAAEGLPVSSSGPRDGEGRVDTSIADPSSPFASAHGENDKGALAHDRTAPVTDPENDGRRSIDESPCGPPIWRVRNKIDLLGGSSGRNESESSPSDRNELEIQMNEGLKNIVNNDLTGVVNRGLTAMVNKSLTTMVSKELTHSTESKFNSNELEFNISATQGAGFDGLLTALQNYAASHLAGAEQTVITRERHRHALRETQAALRRALSEPLAAREDLVAEELRLATRALGRLTGRVDVEDILDVIFRDFCIGK